MDLTISHFKPRPDESFSSYELLLPLTAVQSTETVRITDVVLQPSHGELEIPDLPWVYFLTFEDMHDPQIMDQMIHFLSDPHHISFTRCTFGGITDTSRHFGEADIGGGLRLTEINQDMASLLRHWGGHHLDIRQCQSFDDVILDVMGSQENETFACARYLRALDISDCSNFSIAALRRFVESRLCLPGLSGNEHWDPVATRIRTLHLINSAPSISDADRAWFVANVPHFRQY
jgi:hypothetical protein